MDLQSNKAVVRDFFAAVSAGDLERLRAMTTDDMTWWIAPTTIFSGTRDKAAWLGVIENLLGAAAGPFTLAIDEITAEDDRVSLTARGNLPLRDGRTYASHYHLLMRLRGGKVAAVKEYADSYHAGEIFGFPAAGAGGAG